MGLPGEPAVLERGFGAQSAAGSMTALSLPSNVREHGFEMHHCHVRTEVPPYEVAV